MFVRILVCARLAVCIYFFSSLDPGAFHPRRRMCPSSRRTPRKRSCSRCQNYIAAPRAKMVEDAEEAVIKARL